MNRILDLIKQREINYHQIFSSCYHAVNVESPHRFQVIIPVRGRDSFIPILLESFYATNYDVKDFHITIVEHSEIAQHRNICADFAVGYVHIPSQNGQPFNKCSCHNIGVFLSPNAQFLIFHDLDCLVQADFFNNIDACLDINNAEALQTFRCKRVLYCDEKLTQRLLTRDVSVNELSFISGGIIPSGIGAPGGSILVTNELFFKIGGYDPELFWSYSPEDIFFYRKIELFSKVYSCEPNEIFHMYHPPSVNSNPDLPNLVKIMKEFETLPLDHKMEIVNYKASLIQQFK
jgi:predicted glycosyltransferase involved in capsule biosynthesis